MSKVEAQSSTNFLEIPSSPEGNRISIAYHPYFSSYHHDLYRNIINLLQPNESADVLDGRRFPIGFKKYQTDWSDFYAALERDCSYQSDCVIAPVWFAPPLSDSLFHLIEMSNAFTKSNNSKDEERTLTSRFLAVFPYAELRQDDNTPKPQRTYWREEARESITAQMLAETISSNGVTEAIFLDPHSAKAISFFYEIETLCLTTAPLIADWLIENNFVDKNTITLALDLGAAQKNIHLAKILTEKTGINIDFAILGKERSGHSEVSSQNLLFGNPKGKRVILFDDLGASIGSIKTTSESLIEYGCPEIIPCIPHGVLCGKYLENITASIRSGSMHAFVSTNTLPQTEQIQIMPIGVDVLPVENLLAFFAQQVAITSISKVKANPDFQDYILTPKPKHQVLQDLKG